jgi:hypothetical protein
MSVLKELFLQAPDDQMDACLKPLIEKWSDPVTALEVLEVLDKAIQGGLTSGFATYALQEMYQSTLEAEGTTHEDVVKLAVWRGPPEPVSETESDSTPKEVPCELPEGFGLAWQVTNFFGAGVVNLLQDGKKVGWLVEGQYGENVLWTPFDNRTVKDGTNPMVRVGDKRRGTLLEASKALVAVITGEGSQ